MDYLIIKHKRIVARKFKSSTYFVIHFKLHIRQRAPYIAVFITLPSLNVIVWSNNILSSDENP